MKLAIVSLGGKSSHMIANAATAFFQEVKSFDLRHLKVYATSDSVKVSKNSTALDDFDAIYVRGPFQYWMLKRAITRSLSHSCFMPLKATAFTIGHNKFLTLLELQKNHISIPDSYFVSNREMAKEILSEVTFPIIIKTPYGSQGRGVVFADSVSSARSLVDALEELSQPYIIQEYVEAGGTDIRAIVCGNKVVACMQRFARKEEKRANIHSGGTGREFKPTEEVEKVAIKAAEAIGADICGVDLLVSDKVRVLEVNLSPGLVGISEALGRDVSIDVARFLAVGADKFIQEKK